MKWKRSKKTQQDAKNGKESSNSENLNKAQSSANVSTKPNNNTNNVSQESSQIAGATTENQGSARKVQEGESLYRPYVV